MDVGLKVVLIILTAVLVLASVKPAEKKITDHIDPQARLYVEKVGGGR